MCEFQTMEKMELFSGFEERFKCIAVFYIP